MIRCRRVCLLTLCALIPGIFAVSAQAQSADYQKIIKERGPAFVTIKFVLKMESQYGNREFEIEITGVMIDPSGLVLSSSRQLGTPASMRGSGSATPTNIKVLIGDDTEGLPGKVLARDTELDLAWVQLKDAVKKKFDYIDLAGAPTPNLGDKLLFMRRLGKYFERSTTVTETRLAGQTHKPRDLYIPGAAGMEPGLPVFNANAQPLGIVVLQIPDMEEMQSNPSAFIGLGRDVSNGMILPAADVIKATERAKRGELKGDPEAGETTSKPAAEEPKAKKPATKPAKVEDDEDE
jgi:hypothetical protein